jgi:hypothetical protein
VEAAHGEDGMSYGRLGLAYLEHQYPPEGAVEVPGQTRCRDVLEEVESSPLV